MRESATYQAILAEGEAKGEARGVVEGVVLGERKLLMEMGHARFGPPDPKPIERIEALRDAEQIVAVARRVFTASSWDELLSPAGEGGGHQ